MGLPWPQLLKGLEMALLYHQCFSMLFKEKTYFCPSGSVAKRKCIFHDPVEIEKFHRFQ